MPAQPATGKAAPTKRSPGLRRVVVVVDRGVSVFEFAIPCEVFGLPRPELGIDFDFRVVAPHPGPVRTSAGFQISVTEPLEAIDAADLIVIPALGIEYQPGAELVSRLMAAVDRGATVMSLCSGAFVLARAGLLDGRRATTHWLYSEQLARSFPQVTVAPDVLYVHDGPILTCAGTAAGIDGSLYLVRAAYGARVANDLARRMVVPPQRDGGQAQYIATPIAAVAADSLAPVLDWALANLSDPLDVPTLARRAAMSERTFARRFKQETGTTPHRWLVAQRVALADSLLEAGAMGVEEVARECGFGSAAVLRHHFRAVRGTAPTQYRRAFAS